MFVVIAYDIPDDRRRYRVTRVLQDYGQRVQYSVFACDVTPRDYAALRRQLERALDPREDNVRYYALCRACTARIEVANSPDVASSPAYYIV